MSDTYELDPVVGHEPIQVQTPVVASPLDELRKEYEEVVAPKRLYKRFPSRSQRIAAEYKPLSLDQARQAILNESDDVLVLSTALVGISIYDADHPSANDRGLVSLGVWSNQPDLDPLGFDNRLADLIGLKKGSAKEIALQLFEGNDLALATQSGELGEWSTKTYQESLQDFKKGS